MEARKNFKRSLVIREKLKLNSNIDENEGNDTHQIQSRTYFNGVKVRFDEGITRYSIGDHTKFISKKFDEELTGEGKIHWKDGTRYEGHIYKGLRFGKGTMDYSPSGAVYKGEWYMGLKHGLGELLYSSDSFYEGNFCFGMRHGKGIMRYQSGNVYIGDFYYDSKSGFGSMYWIDRNQKYKGYWQNNQHDGMGKLCWTNVLDNGKELQMVYVGLWRNGKREGYGTIYYANGDMLIGNWVADKKEGYQYYIDYYGQEKEILFVNDKMISETKINGHKFASTHKHAEGLNEDKSKRAEKNESQEAKATKENLSNKIKTSSGIIKKSKQSHEITTKKVQIVEPEKIFVKDQTLEEMNIYRQIVDLDSLLKYVNMRNHEKDLLFENVILTLIRHNSVIKRIFEQLTEPENESKSSAKRMKLSKFAEVFDKVQEFSPFLNKETFMGFFYENLKNRNFRAFSFKNQFKAINRLRKEKLGMTFLKIDKDFDGYFSFKFANDMNIDYEYFESSFEQFKEHIRSQKEQRNAILGSQLAQLRRFSRKDKPTESSDTKVMYFSYVDALLRAALLRVNYNAHLLEESIIRLVKSDLRCFEKQSTADQDLLISAINTADVMESNHKVEEQALLDESMYEDSDFKRPAPNNLLKPFEDKKLLPALSSTAKANGILTDWLLEMTESNVQNEGGRQKMIRFKHILKEFFASIQFSLTDYERVMFGFLSESDKNAIDEFMSEQPQKVSELQRSESIQNLVVENMYREKIDNFFDMHGPFFTQLLNANYTFDCTLSLLKKIEVSDPTAFDLLKTSSKHKTVAKKWPQRCPRPAESRRLLKNT